MDTTTPFCALEQLCLAKYLFRLRAETPIHLPSWKGSALHGGFGHALQKVSPFYYQQLFAPGQAGDYPKPLVLLPPQERDELYPPGREFSCELTLFGNALSLFPICYAALEYLGREMGFGRNQGTFSVQAMETALPAQLTASSGPVLNGQDIAGDCTNLCANEITLHFPTRLRLKANGQLLRQSPPFHLFFARLLGRLNTLASLYGLGKIADHALCAFLLDQAKEIRIIDDQTSWSELSRFSGRQQSWMKFGGLLGSITYRGDLRPFLPLLALGEWTHVGGKSSFGLGKFVLERQQKA